MPTYLKKTNRSIALFLIVIVSISNAFKGISVAYAQTETPPSSLPDEWQTYIDPEYGFQVGYPVSGWKGAVDPQNDPQADNGVLKRFAISNEESALINIDVWSNPDGLSIPEWIDLRQKSLLDDTAIIPTTSNITVGGTEGFFIIQPPNPEKQLLGRLITILAKNEFIYQMEYIAQDDGVVQDIYIAVLKTFEFESGTTQPDDLSQVPLFDIPGQDQKDYTELKKDIAGRQAQATASFSKQSPANGATGVPVTVTLKWDAANPAPIKYRYSIHTSIITNDWTSVYGATEVTVTDLSPNKKYYWQVQAVYCDTCVPKEVVSANGEGDAGFWSFTTTNSTTNYIVSGNAGVSGATLTYEGGATTSDSNGNYSFLVPYGWSGTVTPSKTGLTFSPANRSYSNAQTSLTSQNYTLLVIISGNAGAGGVTLNYTGGQTIANSSGNYSFTVPYKAWVGVVIPSHPCYTFEPGYLPYTNPETNQTDQNYTATLKPEGCVFSITRADDDLTKATSVHFTVKFSGDVTGVDASDFALNTFGVSGTSISNVSGSGDTYTVTVNTGTSNGSIRLDISGTATIYHIPGTRIAGLPFTTGEAYTIMKTAAKVAPADFNGDGKTDLAIFRPSTGTWHIRDFGALTWGEDGDIPVPADYNGDGKADVAVFRPSSGIWYIVGVGSVRWGEAGDIPVPADYNGDKKDDIAVFRPSSGMWYIIGVGNVRWGEDGDIPVVMDYNGDGKADVAVFRPSNGMWYIVGVGSVRWGEDGDIPVVMDYNGNKKDDIAVFRPSSGMWYIVGVGSVRWGEDGDVPIQADYNGDGKADIAVFRPSDGTWYIAGVKISVWGEIGDIPV